MFFAIPPGFGAQEKIDLHVWGFVMGEARYAYYALVDAFEKKYPNVNVVIGPTDRGSDLQKLLSGVVGDAPPDVFGRESQLFGDIAARGILMPLEKFIEEDLNRPDGLHEANFPPQVWESGKYKGTLYGIVQNVSPLVLAYNKEHFRQAGLDPERPPKTWEEWLEYTRILTLRNETGRITRLGCSPHRLDIPLFHITQLGGRLISEDGRTCLPDVQEAIDTANFTKALSDAMGGREAVDQFAAATLGGDLHYNPFASGLYSMSVEDDWVTFRVMTYHPDFELGIAPIPSPKGREPITVCMTNMIYFIPSNARHPKEAWDFVRFFNSPEANLVYADAWQKQAETMGLSYNYTGIRPDRRVAEALEKAGYVPQIKKFRDCFEECKEIMKRLVPLPPSPASAVLYDEMRRVMDDVSYGRAAAPEAVAAAKQRTQEQLDLYYGREDLPFLKWKYVWFCFALFVLLALGTLAWWSKGERAVSRLQRGENRMGMLFISPWFVGFLGLVAGPMVFSIAISFCDYDVLHPARYVGGRNYASLVLEDPLFWKSFGNTVFMVLALPLGMAASLAIALFLNTQIRGMSFYRTVFFLPSITPAVATAVLWFALLNPDGLVNAGINATLGKWFGFSAPAWLTDPAWSKPAMVLMGLWTAGGGMILWLAGLQGIPKQLYEAAAIDGAGPLQRFRSITLPMLTPYIFFSFIVGVIGVFQIFAQAVVLTQGGPADSTLFYVYYLFNNAFRYFKMGYASAQAWILFVILLILTALQWRISKKWVHYG